MTDSKLKNLVTEAVQLDRKIEELKEHLSELKSALATEAASRTEEHVTTEGGGSSWTAEGCDGCIARVTFPAPSLKSKVDEKLVEKVRTAAGRLFDRLFRPTVIYAPIDNFRAEAETLLGKKDGSKLIKLLTANSSPKVAFETREPARDPRRINERG